MKTLEDIKREEERLRDLIKFHEKAVAHYQEQLREHINRHNLNKGENCYGKES